MIDCISVENMRLSDAFTISNFVPSLPSPPLFPEPTTIAILSYQFVALNIPYAARYISSKALACILKEHGFNCTVFSVSQHRSGDSAHYADKAALAGIPIQDFTPDCLYGYSIVVDCLLGTGFQGTVRENYRTAIKAINDSDAYVVSVDINSGMNGDTGDAEIAVQSDLTVTIGYIKIGLISPSAGQYMKKLVCVDIGIVLFKEEGKICSAGDTLLPGYYPCPEWLDLDIITVK